MRYMWDKFRERYFTLATQQLVVDVESLRRGFDHDPFEPATDAHRQFLLRTLKAAKDLSAQLDMKEEIDALEQRLGQSLA